ncbi:uncharacterized protein LOC116179564 [Photinus pyralis]|uniref:uncharacterized protein LOC116179564 n=1 Tax=Photinus pyralis TaxID=7054 RepID=UPI00126730FB|nr:uncharacterized protein LOC116179564 [Photinus pyralis]
MILLLVALIAPTRCALAPPETRSLSKCLGAISAAYFQPGDLTLIQGGNDDVLSELFRHGAIVNGGGGGFKYRRVDNYVMEVEFSYKIRNRLEKVEMYRTWNPHARFVVFSTRSHGHADQFAQKVAKQLRKARVVNYAIVLADENSHLVHAWFANNSTGTRRVEPCTLGVFQNETDLFSENLSRNLRGRKLKICPIVWPPYVLPPVGGEFRDGLEVKLVEMMGQVANFTVQYLPSNNSQDWGFISENGAALGSLSFLKSGQCDAAIGSMAPSEDRNTFFDYAIYSFPESLTWCVPHARDAHQWEKVCMVLPLWVTVATYTICIIVGVLIWGFSHVEEGEARNYRSLVESLQVSFSILNNLSVRAPPRLFKARALFITWVLFAMHMAAVYQSFLISVLTKPIYEQKIRNLSDILDHNLDIWILPNFKRYFTAQNDGTNVKVREIWRTCDEIDRCLYNTVLTQRSATCTPRHFIEYAVNHYVTENGEPLLYCFDHSIVTYPLEMLMTRGFPFTDYFRELIQRIASAGFVPYWERRIFENQLRSASNDVDHSSGSGMGMEHLALVFGMTILGHFCALLVFFLELYIFRRT